MPAEGLVPGLAWDRDPTLVEALFHNTNPGQKQYIHPFQGEDPLEHDAAPGSRCQAPVHRDRRVGTELFFFRKRGRWLLGSVVDSVPFLHVHLPSVMRGRKLDSFLAITNHEANRDCYETLAAVGADHMRRLCATPQERRDAKDEPARVEPSTIESAMYRCFPGRLLAVRQMLRHWRRTKGPVFAVDLSLMVRGVEGWQSDSFYQLALGLNRETTERWKAEGLPPVTARFDRLFVLKAEQVEQFLSGEVTTALGQPMGAAQALDAIFAEQRRAGINVLVALLEDLDGAGLAPIDVNYVVDRDHALGIRSEYSKDTHEVVLDPLHRPVHYDNMDEMRNYRQAVLEGDPPKLRSWSYSQFDDATKLLEQLQVDLSGDDEADG